MFVWRKVFQLSPCTESEGKQCCSGEKTPRNSYSQQTKCGFHSNAYKRSVVKFYGKIVALPLATVAIVLKKNHI